MYEQIRGQALGALGAIAGGNAPDIRQTTHDELIAIDSQLREISGRAFNFACRAGVAAPSPENPCGIPAAENLIATVSRIRDSVNDLRKSIELIESIA